MMCDGYFMGFDGGNAYLLETAEGIRRGVEISANQAVRSIESRPDKEGEQNEGRKDSGIAED